MYHVTVAIAVACSLLAVFFLFETLVTAKRAGLGPSKIRGYLRMRKGLCVYCGYNLIGNVSGTCPECGGRAIR